jgi:hypothetical protein
MLEVKVLTSGQDAKLTRQSVEVGWASSSMAPAAKSTQCFGPAPRMTRSQKAKRTPKPQATVPRLDPALFLGNKTSEKNGSFSLIERVILSAGAMLIFSVSFQIDQTPEGEDVANCRIHIQLLIVGRCGGAWCVRAGKAAGGT